MHIFVFKHNKRERQQTEKEEGQVRSITKRWAHLLVVSRLFLSLLVSVPDNPHSVQPSDIFNFL